MQLATPIRSLDAGSCESLASNRYLSVPVYTRSPLDERRTRRLGISIGPEEEPGSLSGRLLCSSAGLQASIYAVTLSLHAELQPADLQLAARPGFLVTRLCDGYKSLVPPRGCANAELGTHPRKPGEPLSHQRAFEMRRLALLPPFAQRDLYNGNGENPSLAPCANRPWRTVGGRNREAT